MNAGLAMLVCCVLITRGHAAYTCRKFCQCSKHNMYCNGQNNNLRTIPLAPLDIVGVYMKYTNLTTITRNMMANVTHCKLKQLYLSDNLVTHISPDAFKDLKYLTLLEWSQDELPILDIVRALADTKSPLRTVKLLSTATRQPHLNTTMFNNLKNLKSLTISLGGLLTFDASGLSTLTSLKTLDLANNRLTHFLADSVIPNVEVFRLSGNNFVDVPVICHANGSTLPRLRHLDISNNAIRNLNVTTLACLRRLQKLLIGQNRIAILRNNTFACLQNLRSLNIQKMFHLKFIEQLAFNSSLLYKLYFSQVRILSKRIFNPETLFVNTPKLGLLDMTDTKLDISVVQLGKLLMQLKNVEKLTLQATYIKELPSGIFQHLRKLHTLILSGNFISSLANSVFANVSSIRRIYLGGCNIKTIGEQTFPLEFRLHVKEIDLSNNPFTCTCDLLWFRNWMKKVMANHSIVFKQYPHRYECRAPNVGHLHLKDFNPTAKSCTPTPLYLVILAVTLPLIISTVIFGAIGYRYRWYLLYWISLLRRKRGRKQYGPMREMVYSAFVSYSNPDRDWLQDELLVYLEDNLGYTICEHNRNFPGGKMIVDNVIEALDTSEKTILVISNNYMTSDWCKFELQMTYNLFLKREVELIVILLEEVKAKNMTSTLRALMNTMTYLIWSANPTAKQLFKQRLQQCMQN